MFPAEKLPALRLPDRRGDVISPDESFITENTARRPEDLLAFWVLQLRHVMVLPRNRLGYVSDAAGQVCDDQRSVARRLVFSGPQLLVPFPEPARPQRAVYQGDRVPGSLGRLLRGRPEASGGLLDEGRQERDVPRDRSLINVKYLRPYFLDDVLAHVSAGNH